MTHIEDRGAAIVTGGASGLGAATVERLASDGYRVLLVDRDEDRGQALAARLGTGVVALAADVVDAAALDDAVATAAELSSLGLRVSVACAGIGPIERLYGGHGSHRPSTFKRVVDINVIGTFNLLSSASATMSTNEPDQRGERGVHVLTASVAAYEGKLGHVAYAASKAAVVGMTLPAARDLAEFAIRVCAIAPGLFRTPLMDGLPPAALEMLLGDAVYPHRLGEASEFAALVSTVVSNRMLNGETIRLDGAARLSSGIT